MEEQEEVRLLNEINALGDQLRHLVNKLDARARTQGDVEARCVATGRTNLQAGLMWLRRAVEKPAHF